MIIWNLEFPYYFLLNLEYVCDNLLNGNNLEAHSPVIRKIPSSHFYV